MKLIQLIYISTNAKQMFYVNIPHLKMCAFLFLINSNFKK
jgi:hypothetical protein